MFQIRMSLNVTARQKDQAHKHTTSERIIYVVLALCCWRSSCSIFAEVVQVLANAYASLHWGHVLFDMFSLLYCFMLQASIGISNHGLTKTDMYMKLSIIAIRDSNVPSWK